LIFWSIMGENTGCSTEIRIVSGPDQCQNGSGAVVGGVQDVLDFEKALAGKVDVKLYMSLVKRLFKFE